MNNKRNPALRSTWLYHDGIKALSLILCAVCLITALFSLISVTLLAEFGFYTGTFEATQGDAYTYFGTVMAESALREAYHKVLPDELPSPEEMEPYDRLITSSLLRQCSEKNVFLVITDPGGNLIASTYEGQEVHYEGETSILLLEETIDGEETRWIERFVHFYIPAEKTSSGLFYIMDLWLMQVYHQRFALIVIGALSCVATALLFVLLLSAAGRHPGERVARLNVFDLLPTDLMILFYAIYAYCLTRLIFAIMERWDPVVIVPGVLLIFIAAPLLLLFCMSFATRCKCSTLIKNTLCHRILSYVFRALRWLWHHAFCPLGRTIHKVIGGIPLVAKSALIFASISLLELLVLLFVQKETTLLIFWLIETAIFGVILLGLALAMRRLQTGGEALSHGELQYKIDTSGLPGEFRRHAENLNSISDGMAKALEERVKSERFRTELITNVSHDIKTPLTTIISYVNLLRQENFESEAAEQYLSTLDRQSTRLKKLMEDLIEVSKASTGNLSVTLAPCRLEVLLSQALGEYVSRMEAADLIPVLHTVSPSPVILADGRLLWRVFDNLLGNAVKYAMPGTRIYLDVLREGNTVSLLFRNISKEELNVPASDLLERFVRGDRSRHTEGSGLGLSIALSLTELMGGNLSLEVDGDLFKATLTFPVYEEAAEDGAPTL